MNAYPELKVGCLIPAVVCLENGVHSDALVSTFCVVEDISSQSTTKAMFDITESLQGYILCRGSRYHKYCTYVAQSLPEKLKSL